MRRGSRNRQVGAAAVEMALLTPFLMMILFGIIEFGWLFMVRQVVNNAAAEVARIATLPGYDDSDGSPQDEPTTSLLFIKAKEALSAFNVSDGDIHVHRDPAWTVGTDPNEVITIWLPLNKIALPGFVLKTIVYGADYDTAKVSMQVTMAHPKYTTGIVATP